MHSNEKNQNTQSIWAWKNTAHITKTTMEFEFAIAAVTTAATVIYAAAKGVALSSALPAFLANPWVIVAIASYVAIYFVARSISSYQQLYSMEGAKGKDGKNGEDANFSVLLSDAIIKSGTISVVESGTGDKKTEELFLVLPIDYYKALIGNDKKAVHVLLAGKKVEFEHKDPIANAKEYKVKITKVGEKDQLANMKAELGMAEGATSLKVAVSNKDYEALKGGVSPKLQEVVVDTAISEALKK